jgi:hypothetical protein
MIATSGGFPAASRVLITGRKSRADSYFVLMPVFFVNWLRTFWKASCSLPPQSEKTVSCPSPFAVPPPPSSPPQPTAARASTANAANGSNHLRFIR